MPARVLVTRPQPQADAWVRRLCSAGLPAKALPLIEIGPAPDPVAVRTMAAGLRAGMLVMFVSPNAVSQFAACLPAGWVWPDGVRAACTGPGTMAALQALVRIPTVSHRDRDLQDDEAFDAFGYEFAGLFDAALAVAVGGAFYHSAE